MPGGVRISQGCLADKDLFQKIELRFRSVVVSTIALGFHVAVRGKVITNPNKPPYFIVNGIGDVRVLSDERKTSKQMLRAKITPNPPPGHAAA